MRINTVNPIALGCGCNTVNTTGNIIREIDLILYHTYPTGSCEIYIDVTVTEFPTCNKVTCETNGVCTCSSCQSPYVGPNCELPPPPL